MVNRDNWIGRRLAPLGRAVLNVFYPRVCRVCDTCLPESSSDSPYGEWLCQKCEGQLLPLEKPYCQRCGEPYAGATDRDFVCENCGDLDLVFDFAVAGYLAEGPLRELVHGFKYGKDEGLRACLGALLERALGDERLAGEDLTQWGLIPVPLHHARQREREFNQAEELCHVLSQRTAIPTWNALKRTRSTRQQASLTRKQRLDNLRGAFALRRGFGKDQLAGRRVLLVDDVLTTGSTTDACARVLKRQAGVEKVVVITVARS